MPSNLKKFEKLFKENYSRSFYIAYGYVNDSEASKDIVNDAFEYIWRYYKDHSTEELLPILFQQIKHRCINYLRHNKVVESYASMYLQFNSEAEDIHEQDERLEKIAHIIDTLPPQTRRVLEECYFNQKKYSEVGKLLNISRNTVKKHIMKALSILREQLKNKS